MKNFKSIAILFVSAAMACGISTLAVGAEEAAKAAELRSAAAPVISAPSLSVREVKQLRAAVLDRRAITTSLIVQDFTGNFNDVSDKIAAVANEADAQKLWQDSSFSPTSVLVLQEDPTGKTSFRFSVGYEVIGPYTVKPPLKVVPMKFKQAVRYNYVGAYNGLKKVHNEISTLVRQDRRNLGLAAAAPAPNSNFPVVLRLLSDPKETPPDRTKVQLIVPIS